jgi:hypothetical protein
MNFLWSAYDEQITGRGQWFLTFPIHKSVWFSFIDKHEAEVYRNKSDHL